MGIFICFLMPTEHQFYHFTRIPSLYSTVDRNQTHNLESMRTIKVMHDVNLLYLCLHIVYIIGIIEILLMLGVGIWILI
jgi:hypothetical protein